ncbi:unnamed protein product [Peniophora sp. CBMAI 1063]|nr:unnamed protein product [Peniophora sp. CBMAI 1063]
MEYDHERGEEGIGTFLRSAKRIRIKIGSWLPDDDTFGRTGMDWAVGCIRRWEPRLPPLSQSIPTHAQAISNHANVGAGRGLDPDLPGPGTGGKEEPLWVEEKLRRTPGSGAGSTSLMTCCTARVLYAGGLAFVLEDRRPSVSSSGDPPSSTTLAHTIARNMSTHTTSRDSLSLLPPLRPHKILRKIRLHNRPPPPTCTASPHSSPPPKQEPPSTAPVLDVVGCRRPVQSGWNVDSPRTCAGVSVGPASCAAEGPTLYHALCTAAIHALHHRPVREWAAKKRYMLRGRRMLAFAALYFPRVESELMARRSDAWTASSDAKKKSVRASTLVDKLARRVLHEL